MNLYLFYSLTSIVCPAYFTFQFFMVFLMNFMTLSDILYIFRHFRINDFDTISLAFLSQSMQWLHFPPVFGQRKDMLIY